MKLSKFQQPIIHVFVLNCFGLSTNSDTTALAALSTPSLLKNNSNVISNIKKDLGNIQNNVQQRRLKERQRRQRRRRQQQQNQQQQAQGPQTKIIGGYDAIIGRYPFAVGLETSIDIEDDYFGDDSSNDNNNKTKHICGGSLIAPDIVLTAAHCFKEKIEIAIVGQYYRDEPYNYEYYEEETFNVIEQIKHPLYNPDKFPYDIMILKLDGKSKINPIKLNTSPLIPKDDDELIVMGWGITELSVGSTASEKGVQNVLQAATVHYLNNTECSKSGDEMYSFSDKVTDDMMCASDMGEDSCQGDSGGPLIIEMNNKKSNDDDDDYEQYQVGLVSWGYACALPAFPGVYSRISYQINWITSVVCVLSDSIDDFKNFNCNNAMPISTNNTSAPQPEEPSMSPIPEDNNDNSAPTPVDDNINTYPITILIQMDANPEEVEWKIELSSAAADVDVVATYSGSDVEPYGVMKKTVYVQPDRLYNFIIFDILSDGICCKNGNGYYEIYLGVTADDIGNEKDNVEPFIVGDGNYRPRAQHTFVASDNGAPPLVAAIEDNNPSSVFINNITMAQNQNFSWPFLTLALKFDAFPSEIGWILETDELQTSTDDPILLNSSTAVYTNINTNSNMNNRRQIVIAFKPEGYYASDNAFEIVYETLYLPYINPGTIKQFTFTLTDGSSRGDGLCCSYGSGYYKLYLDDIRNEKVLAAGDARGKKRESHSFPLSGSILFPPLTDTSTSSALLTKAQPKILHLFLTFISSTSVLSLLLI